MVEETESRHIKSCQMIQTKLRFSDEEYGKMLEAFGSRAILEVGRGRA